jgi:hypothetical protein
LLIQLELAQRNGQKPAILDEDIVERKQERPKALLGRSIREELHRRWRKKK